MIGLGIETSCDETSIALVEDGRKILSLEIFSQIELHSIYKGVVPELASRAHLEKINILLEKALEDSGKSFSDLSYVSVSTNPGLMGSLIVGAQMARCISFALQIPVIEVDHLEAHLNAVRLEDKNPEFPYLGFLLSGGNSSVFVVEDFGKMKKIGDTLDDALGEAFDKVGNLLGLPYPGGPHVEKQANDFFVRPGRTHVFPELLKDTQATKILFSYSGLKTSVMYYLKKHELTDEIKKEICYDFQNTAFKLVEKNIAKAIMNTKIKEVVVAGGVAANETLRKKIEKLSLEKKFNLFYPKSKKLCTDNGAMVAALGFDLYKKGKISPLDFKVSPYRRYE